MESLGKIAVVGAGAVGSYYGARLAQAGQEVHLLLRSDYEVVREAGLRVQSVAGDFEWHPVPCFRRGEDLGPVDWIVVATKTTANAQLPELMRPLMGPNTGILTLQNGLGNDAFLARHFGSERLLGGLCFVCINRLEPGWIHHSASGLIRIGAWRGERDWEWVRRWERAFCEAKVPCEGVDSLEMAQWMKLVWNFPFNGLAIAEGGVDTQVLLKERGLEPEIREIMAEIIACGEALGHQMPAGMIEHQLAITHPMGPYRPSSMIDYVEGRLVEYEAIWEMPVKRAEELGVPIPRMRALRDRVAARLGMTTGG